MSSAANVIIPASVAVALTASERVLLAACEVEIESGFAQMREAWRRIGAALGRIHAERLYRTWSDTFEEYVEARWQLPRATAYEWCAAAGVVLNIERHAAAYAVVIEPPARMSHAKALAKLPADQQASALMEARETATANGRSEPTQYEVQRVVTRRLGEPTPRSPTETAHEREQAAIVRHIRSMWQRLDEDKRITLLSELVAIDSTTTHDDDDND